MSLDAERDKAVMKLHSHGLYCEIPNPRAAATGEAQTIKKVVFTGIIHSITIRDRKLAE